LRGTPNRERELVEARGPAREGIPCIPEDSLGLGGDLFHGLAQGLPEDASETIDRSLYGSAEV
jgi:hypothetical protein